MSASNHIHRRALWLASAAVACAMAATPAMAQAKRTYDIPAQPASEAVRTLARDTGLQIMAPAEDVSGVRTNAVRGDYAPMDALRAMVAGTGLEVVQIGANTATLRRSSAGAGAASNVIDEVTVTGSRIERAGFDTLQAATVVSSQQIERRGYTNVLDALQDTPGFGSPGNSPMQTTQGFQTLGQSFANFFGLGSQRTLTLVNGRRFVSGNTVSGSQNTGQLGSQVDLNSIPTGLIERVETIAIGGAPVYGSDAIAGTVNLILKTDYEGLEASAQYGVTEEGDGRNQSYRVLMGGDFAEGRGNAVLSAEYNRGDGLRMSDRVRTFRNLPSGNTNPSDGVASRMYVPDYRLNLVNDAGVPIRPGTFVTNLVDASGKPVQFSSNGDLVPYDAGQPFFGSGVAQAIGGDGLNINKHAPLLTDSRRVLLNGIAHYDLNDNIRVFVETSYANSRSEGLGAGGLFQIAAPGIVGGPTIIIQNTNPFLTDQAKSVLAANGLTTFQLNRNLHDIVNRKPATTEIDTFRFVGGLEGDFVAFGGETWNWDIAFNYGRSENTAGVNVIDPTKFANAVNAVRDAAGNIVCSVGGSCVPINLFGEDRFSSAAAAYVVDRGKGVSVNTQEVITANLSGRLPFGIVDKIAFNIGAERRKETGSFDPDATLERGIAILLGAGSGAATAAAGVEGEFTTHEVYGETIVPLISDDQGFPLIRSAQAEGAVRYVDHSLTGPDTTWSAGGRIEPRLPGWGEGLIVRGVFTHAIRSPAVTELFLGRVGIAAPGSDVCQATTYNTGPNPAARAANCAAALAAVGAGPPTSFTSTTNVNSVLGTRSGNPNLENETADSWSIGLIYQPPAIPGLRMSLDYSRISLENVISNLGLGDLQTSCYDSNDYPNASTCGAFRRMTAAEAAASRAAGINRVTGDLADGFQSGFYNVASRKFRGALGAVEYSFDVERFVPAWTDAGSVRLSLKAFYLERDNIVTQPGAPVSKSAGLTGAPRWSVSTGVGYQRGKWDADVQVNWTSDTLLSRTVTLEQTPFLEFPGSTRVNATLAYQIHENLRAQVAVSNLFDTGLPYEAMATNQIGVHDVLGRRYTFRLTANF